MHPILGDRRRLKLLLIAWGLVGVLLALLARTLLDLSWMPALVFAVPLGLLAAPVSLSAWYLCRAMPLSRTTGGRVAVTAAVAAVVASSLWAAVGRLWWRALGRLVEDVERLGLPADAATAAPLMALLVGFGALAYLLSVTVHYTLQAFEDTADSTRRALQSQIAAREAELRALRAQVDPHFLFNSLNAISGLIPSEPAGAREMCQRLADFLRDSLTLGATPRILLGREIALAEQYLEVERVRFGARLAVQIDVGPDTTGVSVPPLILQPLVENAVRHGIATCLEGGTIEVSATRRGSIVWLVVTNPRDPDAHRRGTGFGLDIVRRRLSASFGDRAALAVEPTETAYRVSITVPAEEPSS